ncbi:chromate efflux transporter [Gloeocapsa sp. PCC 73106]|uniref:chromate efflux transporter n=1 Tax=Gloeocapsa sp. PCC 73106 TaxID=102232 RepID=UPI0002ACE614|nr:chromate efflux transporter [Gloeocapsa sp. PCC 73106]ELR97927.1 chromate transporter, chromate ion transporter family [Gloeocapsa sp. PCC 73106]
MDRQNLPDRLKELAQLFFKLGLIGFGGPQAHIAMIHEEAVGRRGWFTEEEFLEGVAICEMLPGPASTQMGIYTGYIRGGQLGALVAGICFVLPAFLIVVTLSWAYFRFQGVPQINDIFLGVSPVVIAIIWAFCWKLFKKALSGWQSVAIAIAVFIATSVFQINILLQFILAGIVGLIIYAPKRTTLNSWLWPLFMLNLPVSSFWGKERIGEFFLPLMTFFLKVGSFIFGGGLVIIPLLEFEVVHQMQWLTSNQFINGVAIGEITPGPVVITAAFIGYRVAGVLGALVATIGIFTPSFIFIMLAAPFLARIRRNPRIQSFLKGVTPAVLGAVAGATIPLARAAFIQDTEAKSVIAVIIGLISLIMLIRWRRPTWQLVPGGAIVGLIVGAVL